MEPTISEVIGANVHRIRTDHGLTLDDLARVSRRLGMTWNTGRMSRIERGDGAVTVEALMVLSLALTELTHEVVTALQLLEVRSGSAVRLSTGELAPGTLLRGVFTGEVRALPKLERPEDDALKARLERRIREAEETGLPGIRDAHVIAGMSRFSLADERAARKLGMTDGAFIAHSMKLWGRIMSDEVEERAEPGDTPQKKGRITRVLMDELREAADRGDD